MRWPEIFRCASRFGVVLAGWAGVVMAAAGEPRLNQLQVIGTHNSYHIAPASAVLELIGSMPSQVSMPHSPVANARVNAATPGGSVERPFATIGVGAPATAEAIAPLSASAIGTCL